MVIRFKIWRSRRRARLVSRYTKTTCEASAPGWSNACVGRFRNGEEV